MSGFRRFDLFETSICRPRTPSLFPFSSLVDADFVVQEQLGFSLDLLNPNPSPFDLLLPYPSLSPLDFFETTTDLIQISSSCSSALRRFQERAETELYLRNLSDRVAALELGFDRALAPKIKDQDRKYKWTAEIKGPKGEGFDRKYKLVTEAKGGKERNFKWTAEFKGKGKDEPASHAYKFQASTVPSKDKAKSEEKGKEKMKKGSDSATRVVQIEESNPGAVVIRKV